MAKRDKRLYRELRQAGLRKGTAARIADAAATGGKRKRKVLNAAARDLQQAAAGLEERVRDDRSTIPSTAESADATRGLSDVARATAARATGPSSGTTPRG